MNAVFVVAVLLFLVFFWRGLTRADCVQKCLHYFGPLAPLLQWYSLLFIGLGVILFRTFFDVVKFEYIKYSFLTSDALVHEIDYIPNITEAEKQELAITPKLRLFSLCAPIAGVVAAVIVVEHVATLVSHSAARRRKSNHLNVWSMSTEMNMVLLVIGIPIVFIVMAMRAEIRVWAVMTGSAWLPYQNVFPATTTWEVVKTLEMGTFTTDLELAGFFQYLTIFSFGQLCVGYLRNAPKQYQYALKWAGLQGVYLYVIFGALRSLGTLVAAVVAENPEHDYAATLIREKVLHFIGPIFTAATMLCVYNMMIIGKMEDVRARLGSANAKFQGTRALLLVSQIQLQVLTAVTVGSPLYLQAQKAPPPFNKILENWDFSMYRAKLLHAALLNVECLLVVLFNRYVWRSSYDYDRVDVGPTMAREPRAPSLQAPLLEI